MLDERFVHLTLLLNLVGTAHHIVMTLGITLGPLLIVIASYAIKAAYWKLGALDWACGRAVRPGLAVVGDH